MTHPTPVELQLVRLRDENLPLRQHGHTDLLSLFVAMVYCDVVKERVPARRSRSQSLDTKVFADARECSRRRSGGSTAASVPKRTAEGAVPTRAVRSKSSDSQS